MSSDDSQEVLKSGNLFKQGGEKGRKGWKNRFFTLTNRFLCYFTDEAAYKADTAPLGTIFLENCVWDALIIHKENSEKQRFQVQTGVRVWEFYTETAEARKEWIHAINEVLDGERDLFKVGVSEDGVSAADVLASLNKESKKLTIADLRMLKDAPYVSSIFSALNSVPSEWQAIFGDNQQCEEPVARLQAGLNKIKHTVLNLLRASNNSTAPLPSTKPLLDVVEIVCSVDEHVATHTSGVSKGKQGVVLASILDSLSNRLSTVLDSMAHRFARNLADQSGSSQELLELRQKLAKVKLESQADEPATGFGSELAALKIERDLLADKQTQHDDSLKVLQAKLDQAQAKIAEQEAQAAISQQIASSPTAVSASQSDDVKVQQLETDKSNLNQHISQLELELASMRGQTNKITGRGSVVGYAYSAPGAAVEGYNARRRSTISGGDPTERPLEFNKEQLVQMNDSWAEREQFLADWAFEEAFEMSKDDFAQLDDWKKKSARVKAGLA